MCLSIFGLLCGSLYPIVNFLNMNRLLFGICSFKTAYCYWNIIVLSMLIKWFLECGYRNSSMNRFDGFGLFWFVLFNDTCSQ